MKKLFAIIATAFTLTAPTLMQAGEGFYAGALGGVNFLEFNHRHHATINTDTGYTVGVVGGYAWCNGIRAEGEISYRRNAVNHVKYRGVKYDIHGHVNSWSYMANAYYDLPVEWVVQPYVGAGIGYDRVQSIINGYSAKSHGTEKGFAYQVMAGFSKEFCQGIEGDLEYKFHDARNHAYDHSLTAGVKKFF